MRYNGFGPPAEAIASAIAGRYVKTFCQRFVGTNYPPFGGIVVFT